MAIYLTPQQLKKEKLRAEHAIEIIDLASNFSENEKQDVKDCLNKLIAIYSNVLAKNIKVKFEQL